MSYFKITDSFQLAGNRFVLFGDVLSGEIEAEMLLICEDKNIKMQFDSVEVIIGNRSSFGLTFYNRSTEEITQLKSLYSDDIVFIQKPDTSS